MSWSGGFVQGILEGSSGWTSEETISILKHQHICTLFDVGREGDTDYRMIESVEGETLASRLARGRSRAPKGARPTRLRTSCPGEP